MAQATTTGLRGFDSYAVSLGDELRGERASLGKSLLDVQRDLRIKAAHIDAIERADPAAISHPSYVTGYVRAYARYLGLDEAVVLQRFCAEAGFVPPAAGGGGGARLSPRATGNANRSDLDAVIAGSRLAAVSRAESFNGDLGATLRAASSLAVLVAVVGGLGYGSWALLQNIQRVDFSPLPDAPAVLASAPEFGSGLGRTVQAGAALPVADSRGLEAIYALQEMKPPRVALRDGPISTIDPSRAGVYASAGEMAALRASDIVSLASPAHAAAATPQATETVEDRTVASVAADATAGAAGGAAVSAGTVPDLPPRGLSLVVAEDAWVRVRGEGGRVVHEELMRAGSRWTAPEDAPGLTLRAGNAGAVFVEIDGEVRGPLGRPGGVVSNVSLDRDAVRDRYALGEVPLTTSSLDAPLRQR